MDSLVAYMVYHGRRLMVPGIFPRDAVDTLGLDTAKELKPSIPMEVTSDRVSPGMGTDTVTKEEWANSWVSTS
jgi:hypothetical protein